MNNNTLVYNLLRNNNEYVYLSEDLIDIREKIQNMRKLTEKRKDKSFKLSLTCTRFIKNQISYNAY